MSLAVCKAGAAEKGVPLYRHIADLAGNPEVILPVPVRNRTPLVFEVSEFFSWLNPNKRMKENYRIKCCYSSTEFCNFRFSKGL